jgi:hypothetical protein
MADIVEFPRREPEDIVIEFAVECSSVDEARRSLEALQATVEVALNLCGKVETAGDALVLAGIKRLFEAFATLVARDRGIEGICGLPRFRPDPPDAS